MAFKWTSPRTWVSSEVVTAALMNAHVRDNLEAVNGFVRKTADESVTSSTVAQNDNHLVWTIPQAGTYVVDLVLGVNAASDTNGDIALNWTFPTGTMHLHWVGHDNAITTGQTADVRLAQQTASSSPSAASRFGLTASTTVILCKATLVATASGTLTLQWAQFSSSANATTVLTGSHMSVRQVA